MKKYTITFTYISQVVKTGEIEIEAENEEEARELVSEKDAENELYELTGREEAESTDFSIETILEVK